MANRTFRSRRPSVGGARRQTSWLSIDPVSTVVSTAGGTITNQMSTEEKARRPFTIVRTHLTIAASSDQIIADEIQAACVGIAVVSDQAAAIGVTAVPTPDTDRASDLWFLHQDIMTDFTFITGVGIDASGGKMLVIDSKAMRKVNDDQDIVIVVEIDSGITNGVFFRLAGRLLIKEH